MKAVLLALALLLALPAGAQDRPYPQAELESLVAPVALHPDAVLWNVLEAAKNPNEVRDAAAGRGARSPAVQALLPYPELLARMAESPQWLFDLGNAYLAQPQDVLTAVQEMRHRAQANGHLRSDGEQIVQQQGHVIAVQPVVPHYHHVRYYDPVVVYGPAWRPARHIHWRRPVVVHHSVVVVNRPVVKHHHQSHARNGPPSPAARMQAQQAEQFRQVHRIPESKRQPIVHAHDGHRGAHRRGR
jgi:hypothetical protein